MNEMARRFGMELDPQDYGGMANWVDVLVQASYLGDLEVVEAALQAGADPNAQDGQGRRALEKAASSDRGDAIKRLVAAGADVDACDERGLTPLMEAAWFGSLRALRALLAAGADPLAKSQAGRAALHYACSEGLHAESAHLCAVGGFCEDEDGEGLTPLDLAVREDRPKLARMLSERSSEQSLEKTLARFAGPGGKSNTALKEVEKIAAHHREARILREQIAPTPAQKNPRL